MPEYAIRYGNGVFRSVEAPSLEEAGQHLRPGESLMGRIIDHTPAITYPIEPITVEAFARRLAAVAKRVGADLRISLSVTVERSECEASRRHTYIRRWEPEEPADTLEFGLRHMLESVATQVEADTKEGQ